MQMRYPRYFINAKPPINTTVNPSAKRLKYFSIKTLMLEPYFQINHAIKKNRAPRLTNEAIANMAKLISKAPALIVKTL